MKISVVTVAWNSGKTIRYTIESFLSQDYPDKELLVVDGDSKDDTLAIAESFGADNIRISSAPDKGIYDAMNKGLATFSGDAVGFLNSDDCYHDASALTRIAEGLAKAPIVHGSLDFVDNHENKKVVRRWKAVPRPDKGFRTGWMPAHPTFYVQRQVAEAVGEFNLTMPMAADYDWMLRAVDLLKNDTTILPGTLVNMMVGGTSTAGWKAYLKHNRESLRSRRQWFGTGFVDYAFFAKPMRKINQFFG